MTNDDLNRFLRMVHKTQWIDYLEPSDESPEQALERRLRWAVASQTDPAHAEEAQFLLTHQHDLRTLTQGIDPSSGNDYGWSAWSDDATEESTEESTESMLRSVDPSAQGKPAAAITRIEDLTPRPVSARPSHRNQVGNKPLDESPTAVITRPIKPSASGNSSNTTPLQVPERSAYVPDRASALSMMQDVDHGSTHMPTGEYPMHRPSRSSANKPTGADRAVLGSLRQSARESTTKPAGKARRGAKPAAIGAGVLVLLVLLVLGGGIVVGVWVVTTEEVDTDTDTDTDIFIDPFQILPRTGSASEGEPAPPDTDQQGGLQPDTGQQGTGQGKPASASSRKPATPSNKASGSPRKPAATGKSSAKPADGAGQPTGSADQPTDGPLDADTAAEPSTTQVVPEPQPDKQSLKGAWSGTVGSASATCTITVQDGESLKGTIQVQTPDGPKTISVSGRYNEVKQSIRLDATDSSGAVFSGKVNGKSVNGTAILYAGALKSPWKATLP